MKVQPKVLPLLCCLILMMISFMLFAASWRSIHEEVKGSVSVGVVLGGAGCYVGYLASRFLLWGLSFDRNNRQQPSN